MNRGTVRHPHAGEQARRIAVAGTVLLTQVGSGVHGTAIHGQDDRDELGLCLEPEEFVTGLARVRTPGGREIPFEQYELHTAWARSRGLAERSGPGDLDLVVYSARKWARLAVAGNPTVLLPLWVPDYEVVTCTAAGAELRQNAHRFASVEAGRRFLGYLTSQRLAMTGERGPRAAVRARRHTSVGSSVGYDVKRAAHALRLGVQGRELLLAGRVTLPVPEPELGDLRAVRCGEWPLRDVVGWLDVLQADLRSAIAGTSLPPAADRAWVDGWLHRAHAEFWAAA